ncbi:N-acetylmuramoyl-L-alanine amidase [Pseudooceanicola algae]|uniref:Uncharacterized protein n=1 Tax=Pseudooceanicola algae TaxID=1537215 RepID=A0A418SDG3_9RHOB|nr:N-acetylmuramoyl-L-alanine amidase [Pseudooceanicola algae]QPM89394.1 hypothetical protein PSAL_006100 [Pseudooceanicola algae]
MRQITGLIVHCTATKSDFMPGATTAQRVAEVRRWHGQDNGWSDIGYHYLIDRDGTLATGRPLDRTGAHVAGHNTGTIGISLFGGHGSSADDAFGDHFTLGQERALRSLLADLQDRFGALPVTGHNQYAAKACPGFRVPSWYAAVPMAAPKADWTPDPAEAPVSPLASFLALFRRLIRA